MGPKKQKKSKAEIEEERLAKEEEERKAKIIEEKRLAEEKEKKRLEELRIKAEQKEFRKLELDRLKEEYSVQSDEYKNQLYQLNAEEKKEQAQIEWLRFTHPSDEPDARLEKDMNTFISLMKEANVKEMKDAIDQIGNIVKVSSTVEDVWSENLAKRNTQGQQQAIQFLDTLREIILEKLDTATIKLIRFADTHINEKQELNLEEVTDTFSVGMWANYNDMRPIRKSVQLDRLGIHLDIPKQILAQNEKFIYRLIRMPITTYNYRAYSGENRQVSKFVVGDVIMFDILLSAPPYLQLRAKRWTIRDKSAASTTLRRTHYPSSVPCRVLLKVPDHIVITEDVRAAVWNEDAKEWHEDGISEFQYNEANHTVQFYLTAVGTIALVKNRAADLPYKKWLLAPVFEREMSPSLLQSFSFDLAASKSAGPSMYPPMYEKHARLTIETQKHELVIDIIGPKCVLIGPETKYFADLVGVVLHPGALLAKLQKKGVNLLPTSLELNSIEGFKQKKADLEEFVLAEISRGASSLEFSCHSVWNQTVCNDSQIGLLVRETCVYSTPSESFDFECVLAEKDEVSESFLNAPELGTVEGDAAVKLLLVFGNEYGTKEDTFSHAPRMNEVSHMGLHRAITNKVTSSAIDRFLRVNPRFEKAVNTLLTLVKPFSLS